MIDKEQDKIKVKVEQILKEKGIDLVEFSLFFSRGSCTVRCLIDYPAGGITLDECAAVNKEIFSFLGEGNLLGENYVVEVNSPGLERKLKTYKDFLRVKGKIISLWFKSPFEGKQYLEGQLADVDESQLCIKNKSGVFKINFNQIRVGKEKIK
ncbi:MAG: hypothetical protein JSV34_03690 [Candidatus Omnitrophota bacterium]|nr:MAG: hypothetical protein JSV34_03690 [Candidatus Omnitrophota bacterium]